MCSQGHSRGVQDPEEKMLPSWLLAQDYHTLTTAALHWPKQVTVLVQIKGVGEKDTSFG